jgi:hypothetical protein
VQALVPTVEMDCCSSTKITVLYITFFFLTWDVYYLGIVVCIHASSKGVFDCANFVFFLVRALNYLYGNITRLQFIICYTRTLIKMVLDGPSSVDHIVIHVG